MHRALLLLLAFVVSLPAASIGGEVGPNDFRISDMGADLGGRAVRHAVAYSPLHDEYLVVWEGYHKRPYNNTSHSDVFGQFIDASTGSKVGPEMFLISETAPNNDSTYFGAQGTDVVYNPNSDEYVVVWASDDDLSGMVPGEVEIFGQRIDAATRTPLGADFRISDMGPPGSLSHDAFAPAIEHEPVGNTYLVAWSGSDAVAFEFEIYCQRLTALGTPLGTNDFRISDMGPAGNTSYFANAPDIAYSSASAQFLVAWSGRDFDTGSVESEIFVQLVDATNGLQTWADDRRITDFSPAPGFGQALTPRVAYNALDNEFLAVFTGHTPLDRIYGQRLSGTTAVEIGSDDFWISSEVFGEVQNIPSVCFNPSAAEYLVTWRSQVTGPFETTGQRLTAAGAEVGADDFLISTVGPGKEAAYQDVVYASGPDEYFATWDAGGTDTMGENGEEIFFQRLTPTGTELGTDQRVTGMGENCFDAFDPAVAYNPVNQEYLVVWAADDGVDPLVDGEFEIYCQLIDAVTGAEKGLDDARVSFTGPDGDATFDAVDPAVAYSEEGGDFFVVWSANPGSGGLAPTEFEIFGRIVEAETGAPAGGPALRLSDMGPDGSSTYLAQTPAIAATSDTFLLVWQGDDDTAPLVNNDFEIFGQFLDSGGGEIGGDFRISDMGMTGDTFRRAGTRPAVTFCPAHDEFFVVWFGDDGIAPLVDNEHEIFGQRINASTGAEVGANDFRISDMGPDGVSLYTASNPDVAYNVTNDEYVVVWSGEEDTGGLVEGELEIFGQRIRAGNGAAVGTNDFRISHAGVDGDKDIDAFSPAVAWDANANQYLVVWDGEDDTAPHVDGKAEIFAQILEGATGVEVGTDFPLSDMGPASDVNYDAFWPAIVGTPDLGFLIVWEGDDSGNDLFEGESEIFGQRYEFETSTGVEAISGPVAIDWLSAVSPNPSRGSLRFSAELREAARVRARLVNVQGRVVATLADERAEAGTWTFVADRWSTGSIANGVYFLQVDAGGQRATRKVVLLR